MEITSSRTNSLAARGLGSMAVIGTSRLCAALYSHLITREEAGDLIERRLLLCRLATFLSRLAGGGAVPAEQTSRPAKNAGHPLVLARWGAEHVVTGNARDAFLRTEVLDLRLDRAGLHLVELTVRSCTCLI